MLCNNTFRELLAEELKGKYFTQGEVYFQKYWTVPLMHFHEDWTGVVREDVVQ